jgi:hypothetical protein
MIKTMIRISIISIHPNDPNINHPLSLFASPQLTHLAVLNLSNGGAFLLRGEGIKAIEEQ